MMLIEDIKGIKESKKDLRRFGFTVGPVSMAIGIALLFMGRSPGVYWTGAGGFLVLAAMIFPGILKPLNKAWMTLGIVLGWVMTRFILILLFYVAVTPTGLIARFFGKDSMDRRIDPARDSYWQKKERRKSDPSDYEKQF